MSSDGLATALQDSASALMEGGNNLEQSVALIAAANKVVQDPSSVGSALRTISLRLRGTSVDVLEQMGEETDGVIESTSKLQEKLKALTGVDILTNTGAYKDTYTILKEIGSVWQDMSNIDQAAALELMAGKNRANTLAAILNNMEDLQGAYESALNSEGSAFRENEQYLDSIQGRIDLLTNAVQTMWMNFIDDRAVKFIVDLATKLVQLINKVGLLPSLIGGFAAFKFIAAEIGKAFDTTSISAKEFRKTIIDTINAQKEGAAASKMQAEATDEVADAVKGKATADAAETAASTANAAANTAQGAANDAVANAAQRQTQAVGKAATQDIIEANTSKQNAEANAKQAASTVGISSKIKSAFTGIGSALGKIGTGIKAVGAGLGKAALALIAVEIVSGLINKAWGWIDEQIHQVENLKEKVKELNDTYKDTKKELSGNITTLTVSSDPGTYKTLLDEFDQLSGGVNALGENISLTTDQYNRYKEICETIVGINPSLAEGYDNTTQAISANKGALADLIELKKEEARLASAEYVSYGMYSKNSNFESLAQNAINNYQTAQRNLENYVNDNANAFSDAFEWYNIGDFDYGHPWKNKDFAAFVLENIGETKDEIDTILSDDKYQGSYETFLYDQWFEDNIENISENKDKLLNALDELKNDISAIGNPEKFATAALTYSGEDFNGAYWLSGNGVDEVIEKFRDNLGQFNYEKFASSEYGGYIGAYKKYVLDNAEQFIKNTTTTYDDLTSVLENAQKGLLDVFLEVPNALKEYDQLNAGSKSLITEWIKNSEMFKIDENTTQAEILTAKQTIIETIQRIADSDTFHTSINGKQVSAQTIIDQLMSIDKSTNFGKYQDSIEELLNYLWNSFDEETQKVFGDKESFAKTLGFDIILDDSDNISNLKDDISRITGLQGEELEDAIDSLPVTTIEAMLKIDWTAEEPDSLDLQGMVDKALPKKTSINIQTIQTYSSLSESIESFNEALKTSNELFADGAKTTEDYYNSLIDLGIDKGKLQEAIDPSTYIVTDVKKLKELIRAKKEEISTNIRLAKAQAQLQYSDVIQSISDQIASTNVLDNVNQDLVDSLFDQADALRTLINQYQLLENNLLGATNAFTKFTDAQEMDSQNTYGSTLVEMAQTMYDAIYKTGEVGTAQFWAAVKATVPDDIYAGLMPGDKQISAIKNYLQDNLFADLTLNDESFSIDFNAIERFVKKAQSKGLFSGTDTKSFGLSQTFMSSLEDGEDALKKFADQMGVTEEYVYALFAEIDKYNTDGAGLSMLFQLDTSTTSQLTILNTKLEQALVTRKQLLAQNADLTENTKEIYSLQAQQASVKKQTVKDTSQYLMVADALKNPTKTISEALPKEAIIEMGLQWRKDQKIESAFQHVSDYLLTLKEPMAFDLEISKDSIQDSIAQLESTFGKEKLEANLDILNGETNGELTIDKSTLQQYDQLLNIDQLIGNALAENFTTTETFLSEIAENTAIMAEKETLSKDTENNKNIDDDSIIVKHSDVGRKKTSEDTLEDGTEVAVNVKAVADTASAKEAGQEIADEVAKTIEGVTFDEDKLYQAYTSPDEAIKALEDVIKKEGELYELNQDEALVLGFHVDEGSVLTAGNALDYIKKKYNDLYAIYGLHNPQTIEPVSVSTYSQLQGDVASFNKLMSQDEEIIANNTEVTQEYKDALLALGVAATDLEDCFGGTNKLVVKNVDKLEDAVKVAKKNTAQNLKLAKAQARLKYYDLYKELHVYTTGLEYTSDGYAILTDEQRQHIDSLRAEMASVNSAIGQFSLLELQLLGVANAYTEYQNAQTIDSENDYSSQAESMVATFANALNTGDLGSASARAAMLGLVPDEVYKDLDTFEEKMDAVAKYFNEGELTKYFTIEFSDDGNVSSVETTTENLKQFFENGKEKGLFTGDWEHFDIADNVTSLEQFADTMGITEEVAYAMFEALEKHDAGNLFDPSNILEKFTSGDLEYQALRNAQALSDLEYQLATGQISIQEYENKMYGLQGQLKSGQLNYKQYTQAVKDLRTQLDQGKITEEEYNNALYGLAEQHSKLTEQAYEEVTAYNEKTAALEAAKEKLEKYYEILEDGGEVNPEDIEKTKAEIEQLQQELEGLEEPTDMTINLAMEEVQEQIDDFKGQIQKSVEKGDKVAINVQTVIQKVENSGFDLTSLGLTKNPDGTWNGVVNFLTSMGLSDDEDTVNKVTEYLNLVDQEHTLDLLLGSESSTVETLLQSINDILTAIGDKLGVNYTLSVKTGTAQSNVKTLKNTIDSIKPTKNITIWTTVKQKGSNLLTKPIGAVSANGTAHVQGTAHKSGSWGAPKTETALVGELGPELLVRGNRWTTIGENGAEFTDVKKGDIIFNHRQTEDLLSKGYVTGRGKAFAEGTAYAGIYTYDKYLGNENKAYKNTDSSSSINNASKNLSNAAKKTSNAAKKTSEAAEEFREVFDWIEIRIAEINKNIEYASAKLENVVGSKKQNAIIDDMIDLNKTLYNNLLAGAKEYYAYAGQLLSKIPEAYREAAKDGSIAIKEFTKEADQETIDAINDYRDWLQKGYDLTQQAEETLTEISSLAKQAIDNIASDYENKKSIKDNMLDQYEAYNDLLETDLGFESENIYKAIISQNNANIKILEQQREAMSAEFNKRVEAGQITKYSQDWYDAVNDIAAVDTEIIKLKTDTEDYQDAINDLHWDKFDLLLDMLGSVSDEAENLIDILSNDDLVNTDTGEWTKEGITSLGLYAQQMEAAEVQAKKYEEQINYLNKNWKKLGYTEAEYLEKLNDLKDGQYDAINAYYDAKDAIVDLNSTRVDAIKTIIEDEITAYEELINKKKKLLDSELDLYQFQKNIKKQSKDIANLQRKLAALAGDNSSSARAQRAKLQAELAEAQAELADQYYERSVSDQQDALDTELENFRDTKNEEIKGWEDYLEDTNRVVSDSLGTITANTDAVYQTLTRMGKEYGLSITESLTSPWKEGERAIQSFSEKFGISMSATIEELQALEAHFNNVVSKIEQSGSQAGQIVQDNTNRYQEATQKQPLIPDNSSSGGGDSGDSGETYPYGKASETSGNIKEGAKGTAVKAIQYALNKLGYGNSGTSKVDGIFGSGTKSAVKAFQKAMGIPADGIVGVNTRAKFKLKGYRSGIANVSSDQFAIVDEDQLEELVLGVDNGRLTYLSKGSSVIPADLTSNLMAWGSINPQYMLDSNRPSISVPSNIHNTEIKIDSSIGTLMHIDEFNGDNPDEVLKMINQALDTHDKNLNNALRRFAR